MGGRMAFFFDLYSKIVSAYLLKKSEWMYRNLTIKNVFTKIYESKAWSTRDSMAEIFYSGPGSHDEKIVNIYLTAINNLLSSFDNKLDVVDLGCGDFFIGEKIRSMCNNYVACDIVDSLIDFNKIKYRDLEVDFRVLDLTKDVLPKGDIVFVRQVFQHLSNKQIKEALSNLAGQYKYLVLTEHLPASQWFVKNINKPAGSDIRLSVNSGVVITESPFNFQVKKAICLCETPQFGGLIRTDFYQLI